MSQQQIRTNRWGRELRAAAITFAAAVIVGSSSFTFAQTELATLTASDAALNDFLGQSVAISGTTVIAGAPQEGPPTNAGAAYVFIDGGGFWSQQAKLFAADRASNDKFGRSVAIYGNVAVVGAPDDTHTNASGTIKSGSAYVFTRTGVTWTQTAKLVSTIRAANDGFGISIAIEGDVIVVGAFQFVSGSPGPGKAFVFRNVSGSWVQEATLLAPDGASGDQFGDSVAISGSTIIVGAGRHDSACPGNPACNSGAAYVFAYSGSAWSFETKLTAADVAAGDQFGTSVAIDGATAVVGSRFNNHSSLTKPGAAYVYERAGSGWSEAKLTAGNPANWGGSATNGVFGASVGVWGDSIVIGAPGAGFLNDWAYIFRRAGSNWTQHAFVVPFWGDPSDEFGLAIAIDGELFVGGASGNDAAVPSGIQPNPGAAFVFEIVVTGDSDGDGLSDVDEIALGTDPNNPDSDGDGLSDGDEVAMQATHACLSPIDSDSDADGVHDGAEIIMGLQPCNQDSDADGLTDGMEIAIGSNPLLADSDGDGLSDGQEVALANGGNCPNPNVADSDGDSLNDGAEVNSGLNPCATDTDGDGLNDAIEAALGTDPRNADTDGDGMPDGAEITAAAGTGCPDPLNSDSDGDGVLDGDELTAGIGPCDADSDNDGLADGNEAAHGTSPSNPDTDGDGLLDGSEVDMALGTGCPSPTNADSDGDGLNDGAEVTAGSSPCNPDTDGDGLLDGVDPSPLVPGLPPAALAGLANGTAQQIMGLNVALFSGPNNNVRRARQVLMAVSVAASSQAIANGQYQLAEVLLLVVERRIDGASPPPDWMPASPQRATLHSDVDTLLVLLEMLQ